MSYNTRRKKEKIKRIPDAAAVELKPQSGKIMRYLFVRINIQADQGENRMETNGGRKVLNRGLRKRAAAAFWGGAGILLILMALSAGASASVTVNPGGGSYATLQGAFDAINAGTHQGVISISVVSDTTETATAVLNASGNGAASYSSITIQPSGGAARTISGSVAGPLIDLNGATNVTIDGLNSGGNSLTISNSDASTLASTVRFINDASANTIMRSTLLGSTTGLGVVNFGTVSTAGNNGNTISQCSIGPAGTNYPLNGIYSVAPTGANSGNTITANSIYNYFNVNASTAGIYLGTGNTGWTISGNSLYQTFANTHTTANIHYGIDILSGSGYTLTGNYVGGSAPSAGGTPYTINDNIATRFVGISLAAGTSPVSSIQGNKISNISLTTSSGATTGDGVLCGISVPSGSANVGTSAGNTIGAATGTDSIRVTSTTTQALITGINSASTGTLNISNNTIGALTSSGITAAVAGSINGIKISAATSLLTISGNTIGNATPNNLRGGTSGLTTGSSGVAGIFFSTNPAGSATITGNTIQNLSSFGTGAAGYVRGIQTVAAIGSLSVFNITGNTISSLVTNSALTSISNGQGGAVGICLSSGSGSTVSGNTISGISNTNTGTNASFVAGITHANAANTDIYGNRIYNLGNAGASTSSTGPSEIAGIIIRSGTTAVTVLNNMISLGSGISTNAAIIGIQGNHGSAPDPVDQIYFNTINIEGTVSAGAQPSIGFYRGDFSASVRAQAVDFRNNIITNTRTGGTGKHYAIANNLGAASTSATGWAAGASDYNVLNAAAETVGFWSGDQIFSGWKTASQSDANSYSGISVTYVNTASGDLHLNFGTTPTSIESGGITIAGINSDFDLQLRPGPEGSVHGGAFAPDIGADEFDGVPFDSRAPIIGYTSLLNTTFLGNRTLSVTISDLSGSAAGALAPRIYFSKNSGLYSSGPCSLSAGTVLNGTWNCTIDYTLLGGISVSDAIRYFVVAQDTNGNVTSNPAAGFVGSSVNSVTSPPTSPNQYTVVSGTSGSISVGAGQAYTSLTNAGGLFEALNSAVLTGDVTINITSDLTAETGAVALNQLTEEGAGGYGLLIRPAGGPRTISGSSAGSLIHLIETDRVTIDGSTSGATASGVGGNAALRELTIVNTNTGTASSVLTLTGTSNGALHNTLRNLNIMGSGSTATLTGISMGGAAGGSPGVNNDNNRIENCSVQKTAVGIYSAAQSASRKNSGTVITMNDLSAAGASSIGRIGIALFNEDNSEVTENSVGGISYSSSSDAIGIALGSISIPSTGSGGITNSNISRNRISGVVQTGTFSAAGLVVAGGSGGANTIANNMISGVNANATTPDVAAGIFIAGEAGSITKLYYNSVSMTGNRGSGTIFPGFGLAISSPDPYVELRSNIFNNIQDPSGNASAKSYAIGTAASTFTNLASDYNAFYSGGPMPGYFRSGSLAASAGTDYTTLADWQTATSGDADSLFAAPLFVSDTDLHLTPASPGFGLGLALPGFDTDFDGQTRSSNPDIGADEAKAPSAVTTQAATDITSVSAIGNSTVTATGAPYPTAHGVCWNTSGLPTIADLKTDDGAITVMGPYTSAIMGLSPNQQYFIRAYVTNMTGTFYGDQAVFITLAEVPAAPSVLNPTYSTLDVSVNPNANPAPTEFAIQELGGNYVQAGGSLGPAALWQTAAVWGMKTVTGLAPVTPYTFQVKARSSELTETAFGAPASGTTQKAPQNITIDTHAPSKALHNTSFNVAAHASSGLPVDISVTGPCSGGGAGSADITLFGGGLTCTVNYKQEGSGIYLPAEQVTETVTLQYTLTALPSGTGIGDITTSAFTCSWNGTAQTGTCSGPFDYNSQVEVSAAEGDCSFLKEWNTACLGNTSPCTVKMDFDKTAGAQFSLYPLVRASDYTAGSATIAETYANTSGGVITLQDHAFTEYVVLDRPVPVVFDSGWNCNFTQHSGSSSARSLSVENGSIEFTGKSFVIKD